MPRCARLHIGLSFWRPSRLALTNLTVGKAFLTARSTSAKPHGFQADLVADGLRRFATPGAVHRDRQSREGRRFWPALD
jgi:hypothetical protein